MKTLPRRQSQLPGSTQSHRRGHRSCSPNQTTRRSVGESPCTQTWKPSDRPRANCLLFLLLLRLLLLLPLPFLLLDLLHLNGTTRQSGRPGRSCGLGWRSRCSLPASPTPVWAGRRGTRPVLPPTAPSSSRCRQNPERWAVPGPIALCPLPLLAPPTKPRLQLRVSTWRQS